MHSVTIQRGRSGNGLLADGGLPIPTTVNVGYVQGTNEQVLRDYFSCPSGTNVDGSNTSDQLQDNISRSASLSLQIPIFNGYQARSNVQRSAIANQQASITQTRKSIEAIG
ncbi:MAG: hypothetical protein U5K54_12440 [Cytophagales bacterium]|nr:hypothetical protein [Cytophagales bacterium]